MSVGSKSLRGVGGMGTVNGLVLSLLLVGIGAAVAADEPKGVAVAPKGLRLVGALVPRHAREIASSNWSVGAETMGRDFTVYRHWREYLGPLGVKGARIQSGWAKTEKAPGRYDWAWLDEIIPDMAAQGVKPWVCLCYGNPVYAGGGDSSSSSPLPSSPEALKAWDSFVRAFVQRYGKQVDEWEIWNEPQHKAISIPDYAAFVIRTAETVRAEQPQARIFAVATAGIQVKNATGLLEILKTEGKLHLVNAVTYHPYTFKPMGGRSSGLRQAVREFSPVIDVFQGECGIPSTPESTGALEHPDNTEFRQAKWALRRLLGDLNRDIRSSYFGIVDMHYVVGGKLKVNTKGLLATKPDKTVDHPKMAYRALQHVTAVFDNSLRRVKEAGVTLTDSNKDAGEIEACLYEKVASKEAAGGHVVTLWRNIVPDNALNTSAIDVTVPGGRFVEPVYVDMLSGRVYSIPEDRIERTDETVRFKEIPVGDWPVLLADRSTLPCRVAPAGAAAE